MKIDVLLIAHLHLINNLVNIVNHDFLKKKRCFFFIGSPKKIIKNHNTKQKELIIFKKINTKKSQHPLAQKKKIVNTIHPLIPYDGKKKSLDQAHCTMYIFHSNELKIFFPKKKHVGVTKFF